MIEYVFDEIGLLQRLKSLPDNSVGAILLITGALIKKDLISSKEFLDESVRVLKADGILFVQGIPYYLPELGVYLDQFLTFKYWIAIKSIEYQITSGLPSVHAGILLYVKNKDHFRLGQVRFPHEICAYCGKTLKDWGGKSHLMNPEGFAASDVWSNLPESDNYMTLSNIVVNTIIKLADVDTMIIGPYVETQLNILSEKTFQYYLPGLEPFPKLEHNPSLLRSDLVDVVHHGDALEVLKKYPDNSIDLVFADPPYNLDKNYNVYNDEQNREEYLSWCNSWIDEYIRILKPSGSLYLLNLPRWSMYHGVYLNKRLYFQNWIVWDAMSEPRGKLMPAHYGLLFYTKSPRDFTFNYDQLSKIDSHKYCLRASCIKNRKKDNIDKKENLTDIWSDIHRLKHRRDRDYHPCQLPESLMERLIKLSSNEEEIVLDCLAGTGTTPVVAKRLNRRFVAIDIDETYVSIMKEKLFQIDQIGYVKRESTHRPRPRYSKKGLQLELQKLASELGRLPTPEDVSSRTDYSIEAYMETFPSWGKALKAAKLEMRKNGNGSS